MRSLTFTRSTFKDGRTRSETIGDLHVGRLGVQATSEEVEQLLSEVHLLPSFVRWISPSLWARSVGVHFASPYLMASWAPSPQRRSSRGENPGKAPTAVA